jgi:hypothetical protein
MAHGELGEDLRAVGLRVGKVGHGHGVLGADIAAGAAIAAQRASRLLDARRVHRVLEAHHNGRGDRVLAERGTRRLQRAVLGELGRLRITGGTQHGLRPLEAEIEQPVFRHVLRPRIVGEHAGIGAQADACIDERAAAEPAANEHMDIGAKPEVVEAGARAGAHLAAVQLQLAAQLGQARGERAGRDLPAPLDDADPLAGAGKPGGGDAAAIAGADHDHVIGGLHGRLG